MNATQAGFLRGLALATALAAIDGLITFLTGNSLASIAPILAPWQPVILLALRTIEGIVDHMRDNAAAAPAPVVPPAPQPPAI